MWNFREEILFYLNKNEEYEKLRIDEKNKMAIELLDYVMTDNNLNECLNETIAYYVNKYVKRQKDLNMINKVELESGDNDV